MDVEKGNMVCAFERVAEAEFRALAESIRDVKFRLSRLETALVRGAALLLANLVGMAASLAEKLLG